MRRPALRRSLDARPGSATAAGLRLALAMLLLGAATASADPPRIYKWVDSNGIAHYTTDPDRIPKALRNRIESVERTRPTPEAAAATSPRPATAPQTAPAETVAEPAPPPSPPGAEPAPAGEAAAAVSPPPTTVQTAPSVPTTVQTAPSVPTAPQTVPSAPGSTVAPPTVSTVRSSDAWFERDALPRAPAPSILASGQATPAQLAALAAEREALDARIAEVQSEITRDETFLKGLISDPELDDDVPLFDRPEFLEVSKRLPELQARLEELRDERAKLETP